jgi:hypothetical protein
LQPTLWSWKSDNTIEKFCVFFKNDSHLLVSSIFMIVQRRQKVSCQFGFICHGVLDEPVKELLALEYDDDDYVPSTDEDSNSESSSFLVLEISITLQANLTQTAKKKRRKKKRKKKKSQTIRNNICKTLLWILSLWEVIRFVNVELLSSNKPSQRALSRLLRQSIVVTRRLLLTMPQMMNHLSRCVFMQKQTVPNTRQEVKTKQGEEGRSVHTQGHTQNTTHW